MVATKDLAKVVKSKEMQASKDTGVLYYIYFFVSQAKVLKMVNSNRRQL